MRSFSYPSILRGARTVMSEHDAFDRVLAAVHAATLDETRWPATSALIDEACGLTGNGLMVAEGPTNDVRALFVGLVKPAEDHAVTLSYNRAFRAPSVINNTLQTRIVSPVDLTGLAPLLPPGLRPAVAQPFPLVVNAVGSDIPIGGMPQEELFEESLTAYEVSYTGVLPPTRPVTRGCRTGMPRLHRSTSCLLAPLSQIPGTVQADVPRSCHEDLHLEAPALSTR